MIPVWLLIPLILALAGCASTPPETRYYDLCLAPLEKAEQAVAVPLQVLEVEVPGYLDGPKIFYRQSRYEAGHYAYHQWVRPLSEALTAELLGALRGRAFFTALSGPTAFCDADTWKLRLQVEALNEEDRPDGSTWTGHLCLRAGLIDPAGILRSSFRIDEEEPVGERNALGVVEALNRALDRNIPRLLREIEEFFLGL